jgi:hypothetical protein
MGVILPADKYAALPLEPSEEAFYQRLYNVAKKRFWSVIVVPVDHLVTALRR